MILLDIFFDFLGDVVLSGVRELFVKLIMLFKKRNKIKEPNNV